MKADRSAARRTESSLSFLLFSQQTQQQSESEVCGKQSNADRVVTLYYIRHNVMTTRYR